VISSAAAEQSANKEGKGMMNLRDGFVSVDCEAFGFINRKGVGLLLREMELASAEI
jgi:hypothetical protein